MNELTRFAGNKYILQYDNAKAVEQYEFTCM